MPATLNSRRVNSAPSKPPSSIAHGAVSRPRHESDYYLCCPAAISMNTSACSAGRRRGLKLTRTVLISAFQACKTEVVRAAHWEI